MGRIESAMAGRSRYRIVLSDEERAELEHRAACYSRPHREVLRLMHSCDIFVLPSIVEGRALAQQEAMACGLPLIATRNAGADDLIGDGVTGFLVPIRSPEAIAEKINWCAANRSLISGMGIAAKQRAGELSWRAYGETIVSAIRELIDEQHRQF